MPFDNLPDFISRLQDDGELRRVSVEVDPNLEVTEIVDRISKQPGGGPALMFERVRSCPLPLVVNLLGRQARIYRALDVGSWDELQERLTGAAKADGNESWFQKLMHLGGSQSSSPWKPQLIKTGISQQVVRVGRDIDLRELPALQAWPDDAGRLLHGGVVLSRSPETGERSLESIPLQILDRDSLGIHWTPHHQACRHLNWHRRMGTHLPLAIAFGGDPTWQILTRAPLPPQTDPVTFGGCLRGKSLEIVRARQVDLDVPAGAEIILEGYVDAHEGLTRGGRFGQSTGRYSGSAEVPVLHITTVTHRGNPVLTQNIPGRPPMENAAMYELFAKLALPLLRLTIPELVDFRLLHDIANEQLCFVSIRKSYARQVRKVLNALWGHHLTMFCKMIVVVDEDVPLHDAREVWYAVAGHLHPERDVLMNSGPAAPDDFATPQPGLGSSVGLDATRKLAQEGMSGELPLPVKMSDTVVALVTRRWNDYQIDRPGRGN